MSHSPPRTLGEVTGSRRSSFRLSPFDHLSSPLTTSGNPDSDELDSFPAHSPPLPLDRHGLRNNRNGAYAALNTHSSRNDLDDFDEESHLDKEGHVVSYDRMDSWVELVKAGTIKFAVTLLFSALLCVCLKAWEGFKKPIALSTYDVRIFNAVTIAISICLGINILASLKRYAIILRWSILTKSFVSMEAFDLILGIEELTNVVKLMFLSMPTLQKCKSLLRKTRQEEEEGEPGTGHWYAIACALWLFLNIGSQILVASLSLFWPTNPYTCPLTTYGNITVADLASWIDNSAANANQREVAWRYGMDAHSWQSFRAVESFNDLSALPGTPIYSIDDYYEYRFFYRNPYRLYSDYLQSDRSIRSKATCQELKVKGKITKPNDKHKYTYILASYDEGETYKAMSVPTWGAGAVSYTGVTHSADDVGERTCGSRCTWIRVFQVADNDKVNKTSYWECQSSVTEVMMTEGQSLPIIKPNDPHVFGNDKFAQIAAGAVSWTGLAMNNWTNMQFRLYPQGTSLSPARILDTHEVEDIVRRFSIGAIAAYDDHGARHNIHINNDRCDANSQQLNVGWRYVLSILGGIILIQFIALCCLLVFANKTIIRDASFFSTAMLMKPVLKLIGDEPGLMTMSGAQLKRHKKLRYRKIRYDFNDGVPKEVTISFWPKIGRNSSGRWPSGEYR